jgi:hypothetical protein
MKHAKRSFSTEKFAGAIISVVQYLVPLRYAKAVNAAGCSRGGSRTMNCRAAGALGNRHPGHHGHNSCVNLNCRHFHQGVSIREETACFLIIDCESIQVW